MELSLIALAFLASVGLGLAAAYAMLSIVFLAMQESMIYAALPGSQRRSKRHLTPTASPLSSS